MSSASTSGESSTGEHPLTVECRNPLCDAYGPRWEFHHGKYCSNECEHEAAGAETLSGIRFDHRYCYTCGTRLKDLSGTPESWFWSGWQSQSEQAFVGFQYLRPEATIAEVVEHDQPEVIGTGVVCNECGNTEHTQRIDEIWAQHPEAYARRILDVTAAEFGETVDRDVFWKTYDDANFEYAVGRAAP